MILFWDRRKYFSGEFHFSYDLIYAHTLSTAGMRIRPEQAIVEPRKRNICRATTDAALPKRRIYYENIFFFSNNRSGTENVLLYILNTTTTDQPGCRIRVFLFLFSFHANQVRSMN